ncbi:GNAT family N-acetyltransferase [Catenovulum sediminis]|uniref:GNAT family N-acetyltransferase n=1 Tax=Catenovulum sediminis TaxID=1740262 RepID=A0ABV1RIY7_9ALTE
MENTIEQLSAAYLSGEDINIASSLLYLAYHDDPFFMDCFKHEEEGYEQRLRAAIREELSIFWEQMQPMIGVYDEDDHLLAVACLIEPDSNFSSKRFWHWRLKMMLTAGYLSTKNLIDKEEKVRAAIPYSYYHLLAFVAVHPNHQHHGVGRYLMDAIDSMVTDDEQTDGVGVLVTVPKYERFFDHANYHLIKTIKVGNVDASLMFKEK